jgi:3-isopropylmalate/(R)-2-methylmalate dehydratase small subunit
MEKFTTLTAVAAPLSMINVDTDKIIPKQFLKTIARTGLAKGLFYELRYDEAGKPKEGFVLDQPAYQNAKILVAGKNFGCGSSREHAPWALLDFGIRCVIASSFGDIFYNNCFKNGILPVVLPQEQVDLLMDDADRGANAIVTVDLEKQEITGPDGGRPGRYRADAPERRKDRQLRVPAAGVSALALVWWTPPRNKTNKTLGETSWSRTRAF